MIKNIVFNAFLFTLLASCTPQAAHTQVTATTTPITIPTQIATPLVIVSRSGSLQEFNEEALLAFAKESDVLLDTADQPLANQGIVKDDDGTLWMYDETQQKLVTMKVNPNWEVLGYTRTDNGDVQAELVGDEMYLFDPNSGEWNLVKKEYTSCLDPELIKEIDENFKKGAGMSVEDFMGGLIESKSITREYVVSDKYVGYDMMYVGNKDVSLSQLSGFSEGDSVKCAFFVSAYYPESRIPVILYYVRNGRYIPMTNGLMDGRDGINRHATQIPDGSAQEVGSWLNGAGGPQLGDVFYILLPTFSGIDDPQVLNDLDTNSYFRGKEWRDFLENTNSNFLSRLQETNLKSIIDSMKASEGDVGVLAFKIYWRSVGGPIKY